MVLFEERTMTLLRKAYSEMGPIPTEKVHSYLVIRSFIIPYSRYPSPRFDIIFFSLCIFFASWLSLIVAGYDSVIGVFLLLSAVAFTVLLSALCRHSMNTAVTVTLGSVTIKRGGETHVIPAEDIESAEIEDEDTGRQMKRQNAEEYRRGRIYYQLRTHKSILLHVRDAAPVRIGTKRPDEFMNAVRTAMEAAEEEDAE